MIIIITIHTTGLVYSFNGIQTHYGYLKGYTKGWFMSKCPIIIITIYLKQIICTVIWFQVFLSNTNNLHTVIWFQVFLSDY